VAGRRRLQSRLLPNLFRQHGDQARKKAVKPMMDQEAIDARKHHLDTTLLVFKEANLSINATMSPLLVKQKKKKTLGHVLSRYGMSKSPDLVSRIQSILQQPAESPEKVQ
jgi:hypothetical protein